MPSSRFGFFPPPSSQLQISPSLNPLLPFIRSSKLGSNTSSSHLYVARSLFCSIFPLQPRKKPCFLPCEIEAKPPSFSSSRSTFPHPCKARGRGSSSSSSIHATLSYSTAYSSPPFSKIEQLPSLFPSIEPANYYPSHYLTQHCRA